MFKKIEKGTEEHTFFGDYVKFRQQFYEVGTDNEDEFLDSMTRAATELGKKYENTTIAEYARKLIVDHMDDVDRRAGQKQLLNNQ